MPKSEEIVLAGCRLGWSPVELRHAQESVDSVYVNECILPLLNGRSIHTPAFPQKCDYVRIVQDGYELAYFVSDEWAEDPAIVMGAIIGCAHGVSK